MHSEHLLRVIRYRAISRSPIGKQGSLSANFRQHIRELALRFEIVSIHAALDFIEGAYRPRRNLCLLTFDCGLREHYTIVVPILRDLRVRAVFSLVTSVLEERRLAASHLSHMLMAELGFEEFATSFFRQVVSFSPTAFTPLPIDVPAADRQYPADLPEVARFKYLLNFGMESEIRDRALRALFARHIGDESAVADSHYIRWGEARKMQDEGMLIGGQTHSHAPLARLSAAELAWDLETCYSLLRKKLAPQNVWPFSYPGGTRDSYHVRALRKLQQLGFRCAFSSESLDNRPGINRYMIARRDGSSLD